jgi:pimeloyl-ACP methyl ester carboxylesterase
MSTFVLVHGAWHGGWCWARVRSALQAAGHEVFTPTLTGVADRSHQLAPEINLTTHAHDVANLLIWEDLSDVVLCGHSYGGCVISNAAALAPGRIASLVFLDAFVPDDGQSLHDCLPPEQRQMQLDGADQGGEAWRVPPIPAEVFNVNPKDRAWVNSQCTPQPLATFQEPVQTAGALGKIRDKTYIWASGWEGSPFAQFHDKAKAAGWNTLELACGHDVMLDMPEALTEALLAVARAH